jgi:hypothetical protein
MVVKYVPPASNNTANIPTIMNIDFVLVKFHSTLVIV